jgi:NRAMP (natural resistance-associated macrophage protein)-like metal ion transporter
MTLRSALDPENRWAGGAAEEAWVEASRDLGPGWIVTAAFIGPGTITTAGVAGASFGHALLWAVAFSVLATLVLQEMSARLGAVTRRGLGEALRTGFSQPRLRIGVVLLVVPVANALGGAVIVVVVGLGGFQVLSAIGALD